jgi:hypothetical protein
MKNDIKVVRPVKRPDEETKKKEESGKEEAREQEEELALVEGVDIEEI